MSTHLSTLWEYPKPLESFLSDPCISEIVINEPGIIFIEKGGQMTKAEMPLLTYAHLRGLAD